MSNVRSSVGVHDDETVYKDHQAHSGGRNQHRRVEAEPSEVHGDLLTKILPGKYTHYKKNIKNIEDLLET